MFEIAGVKFGSKVELFNHTNAILSSSAYSGDTADKIPLSKPDTAFIRELFRYHPQSKSKLSNVKTLLVGYFFGASQTTKCFYILKHDGSVDSASYVKAVNGYFQAMRAAAGVANGGATELPKRSRELAEGVM